MEASSGTRRIRVGEVLGETFSIYGRNLAPLLAVAFVLFAIVGILSSLVSGPARDEVSWGELLLVLLAVTIRMIGTALYTGFVVRLVEDVRDGRRDVSVDRLLSSAAPAIPALVVMSVLFGITVGIGCIPSSSPASSC